MTPDLPTLAAELREIRARHEADEASHWKSSHSSGRRQCHADRATLLPLAERAVEMEEERDELVHDIERHIAIASAEAVRAQEALAELARLRAELEEVRERYKAMKDDAEQTGFERDLAT